MWVIARKADTSTGVEYIKQYSPEEVDEMFSKAQIYHSEPTEEKVEAFSKELGGEFKAIKFR